MRNRNGFTLVELMVVIVVIGVLAALAIPRFMGASNRSKASEFKPVLKQILTLQEAYKQEKDHYSSAADGAEIGFSAPANLKGTIAAGTKAGGVVGSARFEYTVKEPTVAKGIAGVARPVTDDVLKDMEGTPLTKAKDFGCADTSVVFTVSDKAIASVTNLDVSADCTW